MFSITNPVVEFVINGYTLLISKRSLDLEVPMDHPFTLEMGQIITSVNIGYHELKGAEIKNIKKN